MQLPLNPIAKINATSPILFTNIALSAALLAWRRVNQKFINKYEQSPTPSHPKNNIKMLSLLTSNNIKTVNKLR